MSGNRTHDTGSPTRNKEAADKGSDRVALPARRVWTAAITMIEKGRLWVRAYVPENHLDIRIDQQVGVTLTASSGVIPVMAVSRFHKQLA